MRGSITGLPDALLAACPHSGARLLYEEDAKADGSSEARAYLTGPLGVVAVHTTPSTGAATLTYWHRDHLGSLTVTTNETGVVKDRMRFDPWGKPMTPLGARAGSGDRGFTGHEHLAGGLIHMNGRIYDPVLARFLSADIVVQAPNAITSYNRYGYVMNNPLIYTDPSGYFIPFVFAVIAANVTYFVSAAVLAGIHQGWRGNELNSQRWFFAAVFFATAGVGGMQGVIAKGFAMGGIQSGSIEGAIAGAISSVAFYGAGSASDLLGESGIFGEATKSVFSSGGIGRAGMHAIAGCAMAAASGGKCGQGAASAGFAQLAGPMLPGQEGSLVNFAGLMVVGGVSSVLGGGKFKNGAITAAYGHLFNFVAHRSDTVAGVDPSTKETVYQSTYTVEFASDTTLALARELANEVSPSKRLKILFETRDKIEGIAPDGWGTPDIDVTKKVAAYNFDPTLKNIYLNAGYKLGQALSPAQFDDFLRRAVAYGRPEFADYYGDRATAQRSVDQKYENSWSVRIWKGVLSMKFPW